MRTLTHEEINEVSGGLDDLTEGAAILLGAGIALAAGPFGVAAAVALGGSIGLSSWRILQSV